MASIVDYLKESGQDSSLTARATLATSQGLVSSDAEYLSLASAGQNADINTKLLSNLQSAGSKPAPAPSVVPTSQPGSAATYNNNTVTSADLERGSGLPDPATVIGEGETVSFADRVSSVAGATLNSSQLEVDKIRAALQTMNTEAQEAAQARKDKAAAGIEEFVDDTSAQDALAASNEKFKVEENIKLYSDIQTKLVDAQQALEMGLVYEKDRPARMKFITGAESTLMKQGLATIGALQGTAAVIKGNLDLAKAYGDQTVDAIIQDNQTSFTALTTLLDLATNDLVDLQADEREIINDRLSSIEEENSRVQENKESVLDLMKSYPKAFLAGGVTLLDSEEQALGKMLPTMAADEIALFNASISTGVDTQTDKDGSAQEKESILNLKANGATFQEVVDAYGNTVSIDWIRDLYSQPSPKTVSAEDQLTNQYYGQFLNPDGTIKTGHSADVVDGKLVVKQPEEESGGIGGWFAGVGKALMGN